MALSWKLDDKFTAGSRAIAMRLHRPTMQFNNLPNQCEADSQPTVGSLQALLVLYEEFEDLREHGFRDTPTLVFAPKDNRFAVSRGRQLNGFAWRRISHG